jgi:hypothetical protein
MAFDLLYQDRHGDAGATSSSPCVDSHPKTGAQVVERGYEGYVAKDEAGAYQGRPS